jgi:hypothetical protein
MAASRYLRVVELMQPKTEGRASCNSPAGIIQAHQRFQRRSISVKIALQKLDVLESDVKPLVGIYTNCLWRTNLRKFAGYIFRLSDLGWIIQI